MSPYIWVVRGTGGKNAHIRVDDWWFEITAHVTLCLCGHSSHIHHPIMDGACAGCDCTEFETDGMSAAKLQRQSIEAILAHEVAHLHQDVHGSKPTDAVEIEYDADHRAVQILPSQDPIQLIRALRYTAHFNDETKTAHGTTEERVAKLRASWPGIEPSGCERPLRRAEREPLSTHVLQLCADHGLRWVEDQHFWLGSHGEPSDRSIHTSPLRSEMDYLAAIHEVGHFALGDLRTHAADNVTVLFENEEKVWVWTLQQVITPASDSARGLIMGCFHSWEGQRAASDVLDRMRELLDPPEAARTGEAEDVDSPPPR